MGDPYTCHACGLNSKAVEAGGMWYCPNKFCSMSGAWNARLEAGYQDKGGGQSEEQLGQMRDACRAELKQLLCAKGNRVRIRILLRCAKTIEKQYRKAIELTVE